MKNIIVYDLVNIFHYYDLRYRVCLLQVRVDCFIQFLVGILNCFIEIQGINAKIDEDSGTTQDIPRFLKTSLKSKFVLNNQIYSHKTTALTHYK